MRKELTIEHSAAYLPYGVKVSCSFFEGGNTHVPLVVHNPYSDMREGVSINQVAHFSGKLLLRPLSQLTETIEHGGERFVPIDKIKHELSLDFLSNMWANDYVTDEKSIMEMCPYGLITFLHSLHVDTFGLIESGLAEPIPSIEQP
jgi:hypothetical protein